jgi:hypothetical protein
MPKLAAVERRRSRAKENGERPRAYREIIEPFSVSKARSPWKVKPTHTLLERLGSG